MSDAPRAPEGILPAGRFLAKVVSHDLGKTSNGNDQLAVEFAFTGPDGAARSITAYMVFTEKTMASEFGPVHRLQEMGYDLEALGFSDAAFAGLAAKSVFNPLGGALVGKEADITIKHESSQDGSGLRAVVAWINKPGGGGLAMKDRVESADSLKTTIASLRALAGRGPAPSTGPSKPPPAAGKRSDLPF